MRGPDGPPRTLHLDARTHLTVQVVDRRDLDGREVEFVTEVGDYRPVSGLVFPHRMEVGPRGSPDRQRLVIRKIEVNPPLDDARFAMPGSALPPVRRPSARPPLCYPDARGVPVRPRGAPWPGGSGFSAVSSCSWRR